jgi:CBS domain-containing protein
MTTGRYQMKTAEDILEEKGHTLFTVTPDTTVLDALTVMREHRIGAIVVKEKAALVGIWTERDLMRNTLIETFDPRADAISEYMVKDLKYSRHDATVYQLEDKFLGMRLRHLLINKNGACIGIISTRDVMRMVLNDMQEKLAEATSLAGWEYYENWRWR